MVVILVVSSAATVSARRPNVLFLLADDQRADTVSALGNPYIQTPYLDTLVGRGFAFTRAYDMGSINPAVCVPSRAMLLTGRNLFTATSSAKSVEIPAVNRMWPEVFRAAGYKTIGIGKWHNDQASFNRAFSGGGPVFFGGTADPEQMQVYDYRTKGDYTEDYLHPVGKHASEAFADAAIAQLRANRLNPFVMFVAFTAPHDPRRAPADYMQRYSPDSLPLPANFMPAHPFDNGAMNVRDELLLPIPRTPEAVRGELAAYYAMITHMDAQIGRILKVLSSSGLANNTIIVFASDNGLALGSHGLLGKQNLYEHSVRVPLIFCGPGIPGGGSSGLCQLHDIFPTLCALTGLPLPASVQGKSLMPLMRGQEQIRDSIFCAYGNVQRMVSDERWKLIIYPQSHRAQLFDLSIDADELNDLSGDWSFESQIRRMSAKLVSHEWSMHDPMRLK